MHFLVPLCPPRGKTEYKYRTIGKRLGFPGDSDGKESTCNAGDVSSVPGSGRYPREGIAESKYRTIDRGEILGGKCLSGIFILGREISKFDLMSPEIYPWVPGAFGYKHL